MAVIRQQNVRGQQRLDVPLFRALESSICGDFDLLAGRMLAGKIPVVLTGFGLNAQGATHVSQLLMKVADGMMIHYLASESGSIFSVPPDRADEKLATTNPRVSGQFAPNQVNYVGIDFVRVVDDSTSDLQMFLDATTLIETPKDVPLARILDYRITITTVDFSSTPGVCPIAKVKTDSDNNILQILDARNMFFRLGSGGTVPNAQNAYSWPAGRKETASADIFSGGDKAIASLKNCLDAFMTRLWEIGGGEYWYSPTADRNVRMVHAGSPFTSDGEFFEWDGSNLHWKGLRIIFDNSTAYFNEVEDVTSDLGGLTDLADGECIYVDLDRTTNRSSGTALKAKKAVLRTLGPGSPPGSRIVLVWRHASQIFTRDQGYPVGSSFHLATVSAAGTVRVSQSDSATGSSGIRVATVDQTSKRAIAGGVSRGASDFFGGAGDINVGGLANDQNVRLTTARTQDAVVVRGPQTFLAGGRSSLEVINGASTLNENNRIARFAAFNHLTSSDEDGVVIEANGAMGWRVVDTSNFPVVVPSPTVSSPIRAKTFFQTNGLSSPNTRDQFCVMWFDGNMAVIAESPTY